MMRTRHGTPFDFVIDPAGCNFDFTEHQCGRALRVVRPPRFQEFAASMPVVAVSRRAEVRLPLSVPRSEIRSKR